MQQQQGHKDIDGKYKDVLCKSQMQCEPRCEPWTWETQAFGCYTELTRHMESRVDKKPTEEIESGNSPMLD